VQPLYHKALPELVTLAELNGYNLEVASFAHTNIYETDWNQVLQQHKLLLENFVGQISMHGVYIDVAIHSNDPQIASISQERISK